MSLLRGEEGLTGVGRGEGVEAGAGGKGGGGGLPHPGGRPGGHALLHTMLPHDRPLRQELGPDAAAITESTSHHMGITQPPATRPARSCAVDTARLSAAAVSGSRALPSEALGPLLATATEAILNTVKACRPGSGRVAAEEQQCSAVYSSIHSCSPLYTVQNPIS